VSVRDAVDVRHRLTRDTVTLYTHGRQRQHRRMHCHQWIVGAVDEPDAPVTCLWCAAGLSRYGGPDG